MSACFWDCIAGSLNLPSWDRNSLVLSISLSDISPGILQLLLESVWFVSTYMYKLITTIITFLKWKDKPQSLKLIFDFSGYDFGYLLKVLTNTNLPSEEQEFFEMLKLYFSNIYDVKYLMKSCKNLKGGLQEVSDQLEVMDWSFLLHATKMQIGRGCCANPSFRMTTTIPYNICEVYRLQIYGQCHSKKQGLAGPRL